LSLDRPRGKEVGVCPTHVYRSRSFTAAWSRSADDVLLRMSGRMVDSTDSRTDWQSAMQRLLAGRICIDLAGVTEMDARGLGTLADLAREARAHGSTVSVTSANPRVRRLLEVTRLDTVFDERQPCSCAA
jgi:anti-anti-sigma factor